MASMSADGKCPECGGAVTASDFQHGQTPALGRQRGWCDDCGAHLVRLVGGLWKVDPTRAPIVVPSAKVPLRNGGWLQFEILRDTASLDALAEHTGLTVDELLEDAERWAKTDGFMYGVIVDREARTVTQAGEA